MDIGTKIKGLYLGEFKIIGIIVDRRPIFIETDNCWIYSIKLTPPIEIYGKKKENILMNTKYDGTTSSYTRYSDIMEEIKEN